jgi:hypothetical protein
MLQLLGCIILDTLTYCTTGERMLANIKVKVCRARPALAAGQLLVVSSTLHLPLALCWEIHAKELVMISTFSLARLGKIDICSPEPSRSECTPADLLVLSSDSNRESLCRCRRAACPSMARTDQSATREYLHGCLVLERKHV